MPSVANRRAAERPKRRGTATIVMVAEAAFDCAGCSRQAQPSAVVLCERGVAPALSASRRRLHEDSEKAGRFSALAFSLTRWCCRPAPLCYKRSPVVQDWNVPEMRVPQGLQGHGSWETSKAAWDSIGSPSSVSHIHCVRRRPVRDCGKMDEDRQMAVVRAHFIACYCNPQPLPAVGIGNACGLRRGELQHDGARRLLRAPSPDRFAPASREMSMQNVAPAVVETPS